MGGSEGVIQDDGSYPKEQGGSWAAIYESFHDVYFSCDIFSKIILPRDAWTSILSHHINDATTKAHHPWLYYTLA